MRSIGIALLCGLCTLVVANDGSAGGLFRRAPEVGEWAKYESTTCHTHYIGKPHEISVEFKGSSLMKCVGEEVIDNQRYLWIECRNESVTPEGGEHWTITKVLVPEDGLLAGTLTTENVRGWSWSIGGDPQRLDFSSEAELPTFLTAAPIVTTAQMAGRTITVNDVAVELTYAETVPLTIEESETREASGESVWWPVEDLAFGVASVDYTYDYHDLGEITVDSRSDFRSDLVATGTNAVSDLPDHN